MVNPAPPAAPPRGAAQEHTAPRAIAHAADGWRAPAAGRAAGAKIRIVYCIDSMGVGGTELNAVRTAERLDRSRFELVVAALQPDGPLASRYAAARIPVVGFPITSLYGAGTLRQGLRFARLLRERRIDILHCHDFYSNVFGAPWGRLARAPVVITSRRWWHSLPSTRLRVANRWANRLADRVLANSPRVAQSLAEVERLPAERTLLIPNFVDEAAFRAPDDAERRALRLDVGVEEGTLVVGCISRLVPVKDHESLIRAAAILRPKWPQLRVVLVGDGESRSPLAALAGSLGLREMVRFAGTRPHLPSLHHLFDVSVLCSLSEGFPNSIVEAMAAGRPVVATAVGGNRDAVRPETGLLVPPADPARLAAALDQLLADPGRRRAMGAAAERVARAEYHADAVVPQLEAAYERLVAARR